MDGRVHRGRLQRRIDGQGLEVEDGRRPDHADGEEARGWILRTQVEQVETEDEVEQAEPVVERQLDPRLGLVGGDRHRLRHPLREGFRPEAIDMEALVQIGIGVRDSRHHAQR